MRIRLLLIMMFLVLFSISVFAATNLTLQSMKMTPVVPKDGETVTLEVTLKVTLGGVDNIKTTGGIDGAQLFQRPFAHIEVDATRKLSFSWKASLGLHTAWFEVDKNSSPPDSNPNDNRTEIKFLVVSPNAGPLFHFHTYDLKFTVNTITVYPDFPIVGNPVAFKAKIMSKGGKCSSYKVTGGVDGNQIYEWIFTDMPADKELPVSFAWTAASGAHTAWFKIDPEKKTGDSNRNNNELSRQFTFGKMMDIHYTPSIIGSNFSSSIYDLQISLKMIRWKYDEEFSFTVKVANLGPGNSEPAIVKCSYRDAILNNDIWSWGPVVAWTDFHVPEIQNGSQPWSKDITMNYPPKNLEITCIVDPNNTLVNEKNKDNNKVKQLFASMAP